MEVTVVVPVAVVVGDTSLAVEVAVEIEMVVGSEVAVKAGSIVVVIGLVAKVACHFRDETDHHHD